MEFELRALRSENDRLYKTLGSEANAWRQQLDHVVEQYERIEAENARLQESYERLRELVADHAFDDCLDCAEALALDQAALKPAEGNDG